MSQPEASAPARPSGHPPADRYGRHDAASTRRGTTIGAVIMVLLMLSFAVWMGIREAAKPASWTKGDFTAIDDGSAQIAFTVTTTPGRKIVCTVQLMNLGLTEVGRPDVVVGPATTRRIEVKAVVPTFEQASSGSVTACAKAS